MANIACETKKKLQGPIHVLLGCANQQCFDGGHENAIASHRTVRVCVLDVGYDMYSRRTQTQYTLKTIGTLLSLQVKSSREECVAVCAMFCLAASSGGGG